MKNLYRKIFISGFSFSILKTLFYRVFLFKNLNKKIYCGYGTKILKDKTSCFILDRSLYIDSRNDGQFHYYSTIRLKENSRLKINGNVNFYSGLSMKIFANGLVEINDGTYFSGPVTIHCKKFVSIGKNCSISWNCTIIDSNFHAVDYNSEILTKEVIIGDRVWVGNSVVILPGTKIDDDVIIGAGSVVRGHLLKNGIYAGNPCKLIRYRNVI